MFGVRRGALKKSQEKLRNKIAKKHGIDWTCVNLPGDGWQSWFAGPNRGNPFDRDLQNTVLAELHASEPGTYE